VSSPICGSWPGIYYSLTVTVLFLWGHPLWREGSPSFVYAAGPRQRSLYRVRVIIFYCLRFETPLFVASYDSQGHGGGIRVRLQTAVPRLKSRSQSQFTTGGLPPISLSWCQAPWDPRPEFSSHQLNPYDTNPYVTSSLNRRWVCLLWISLALRQVYISHI
jgi:hypothetical protein